MIPKKIHYCWFGGGEKPKLAQKCIESWKKYCPDYELVEWNENNFDINCNLYVRQAYGYRKYAFVSDYVRLYAMYHYGGIYLDTDVEVIKTFDELLENTAFAGLEIPNYVATCVLACESKFPLFAELLAYYKNIPFINENGSLNFTTNVELFTNLLKKYGFKYDSLNQNVYGLTIYPQDYFCPLDDATGKLFKTENTYAIHWFSKSWIDPKKVFMNRIARVFRRTWGKDCFRWFK